VRPAPLIGGAEQDVAVDCGDVDRLVGGVVDRVDPGDRAGLVGERADPGGVGAGAEDVRRPGEGDDPRPLRQLAFEVLEVEAEVLGRVDQHHLGAAVGGELDPGRDVAVMVEAGDEDLVARAEVAPRGPAEVEVERRHVRPEDDVVRLAAEEAGGVGLGTAEERFDPFAGRVGRAEVAARRGPGCRRARRGRRTRRARS
jgi:hypothetical protein